MEARELRIGNWVKQGIANVQVVGVMIQEINQELLDVDPIPLTEEWLLKFGFDRRGYTSSNGSKLVLHHKEPMYPNGRIYYNSWCIKNELPQYVHQLQNLYFALTGEELTIKQS